MATPSQRGVLLALLLLVAAAYALQDATEAKGQTHAKNSRFASHASRSAIRDLSLSKFEQTIDLESRELDGAARDAGSGLARPLLDTFDSNPRNGETLELTRVSSERASSALEKRMSEDSESSSEESESFSSSLPYITFSIANGASNETFASAVCSVSLDGLRTEGSSADAFYLVPDCFYDKSPSLQSITASNFIFRGNVTYPDPLDRLPTSIVNITGKSFRFIKYNAPENPALENRQVPYTPDWDSFASRHSNLESLSLTFSGLRSAPNAVPRKITTLVLNDNIMSGTIPPLMLSQIYYAPSSLTINLSNNRLTGGIPALFDAIQNEQVDGGFTPGTLQLQLSNNSFSSALPSGLFASVTTPTLYLDLSHNKFSGNIPASFLGSKLSTLNQTTIYLNNNGLTGSIPADLITSSTAIAAHAWILDLGSNKLNGSIPSKLLQFNSSSNALSISINLSFNLLSGSVPNFWDSNLYLSLQVFTFTADNNGLTGFHYDFMKSGGPGLKILVSLSSNELAGALPSSLLQNFNFDSLSFSFDNNLLTGNPFAPMFYILPTTTFSSIILRGSNNLFTGDVPTQLFRDASKSSSPIFRVQLNFSDNGLNGPLASEIFGGCTNTNVFEVLLDISRNQIDGPVPTRLWTIGMTGTGISKLEFLASGNKMTGPLPSTLFTGVPSGLSEFLIDYASNLLVTPLPPGLLSDAPLGIAIVNIRMDNNVIQGGIPDAFFDAFGAFPAFTASFSNCSLDGQLPTKLVDASRTSNAAIYLDNNALAGTFNTSLLIAPGVSDLSYVRISASSNSFSEVLDISSVAEDPKVSLSLHLANNNFTSMTMRGTSSFLSELYLENNTRLAGTLPDDLFKTSRLSTFVATHTLLSGTMPQPTYLSILAKLDLSYNKDLRFCAPENRSNFGAPLTSCNLRNTDATGCASKYPALCFAAPSTCDPAKQPLPTNLFKCQNGVWTAIGSELPTTITIPGSLTATIIQGSLNSTTVIFNGVGATLVIEGCANNLTTITLQLTPSQIKTLSTTELQALITYNASDATCKGLEGVAVHVTATSSTCRRVAAKSSVSSGQLSALFSVDSSHCKTWWIILVSVLGGLVVIAIIVVILLVTLVPSIRVKVRPYSKARGNKNEV